jgi:hypothetical protein
MKGFRALSMLLIVTGLVAKFGWWILAAVGILVLGPALCWVSLRLARRADARHERRAALVARADQQHAWVLAGDDRGIYGERRLPSATNPRIRPIGRRSHDPSPDASHRGVWDGASQSPPRRMTSSIPALTGAPWPSLSAGNIGPTPSRRGPLASFSLT